MNNNIINNLYDKASFFDKYGGDVFISAFVIIVFFVLVAYFNVYSHIQKIRANWKKERCNPQVIPYAGWIHRDDKNKSAMENTGDNFEKCSQDVLRTISDDAFKPIYYLFHGLSDIFKQATKDMVAARGMFDKVRKSTENVGEDVMSRTLNITTPIMQLFMRAKDIIGKSTGTVAASLYTIFAGFITLKSVILLLFNKITTILAILAASIVAMWLIPVTWPAAAAGTATFVAISVPLAILSVMMNNLLHLHGSKTIPSTPSCFDEDTPIVLEHMKGTSIPIKEVRVGDVLANDGSKVTSIMELSTHGQTMYELDGIIVSGLHRTFNEEEGTWHCVKDIPRAKKIRHYGKPFIYCFNTTSKVIRVKDMIFSDWDEVDEMDIHELRYCAKSHIPSRFKKSHIHKYLDGGFSKDTLIELDDGRSVPIHLVEVNDVLRYGERVLGVVEIDATKMKELYEYTIYIPNQDPFFDSKNLSDVIKEYTFKGGMNLHYKKDGVTDCTLYLSDREKKPWKTTDKKLYHLLTDRKCFYLNGVRFYDYDAAIERFLDRGIDFYSIYSDNFYL